ncbi:MAG: peptidylprolyl isomerase [Micromonosporaceae bacterium]|nr:peptidylprolyl isomerase [Micromonosporaceae bacterium]
MTSSRERQQRAAARARLAREMAERQATAKKRRQRLIGAGAAVGLVLVVAGTFLVVSAVTGDDDRNPTAATTPTPGGSAPPAAAPGECAWNEAAAGDAVVDVGTPPEGEPREGTQVMTVTTNLGEVAVELDLAASPCIAASFSHLASQEFYDGTYCHRMFPGMLQCGDPNAVDENYQEQEAIGSGGPAYQYADENLPTTPDPVYYPAGTMAMANSGPGTNGSQFFFIYEDTDLNGPNYSVVGQVVEGMDVLEQVNEIGHDGAFDPSPGGGHPNEDIIIESLRVGDPS